MLFNFTSILRSFLLMIVLKKMMLIVIVDEVEVIHSIDIEAQNHGYPDVGLVDGEHDGYDQEWKNWPGPV